MLMMTGYPKWALGSLKVGIRLQCRVFFSDAFCLWKRMHSKKFSFFLSFELHQEKPSPQEALNCTDSFMPRGASD